MMASPEGGRESRRPSADSSLSRKRLSISPGADARDTRVEVRREPSLGEIRRLARTGCVVPRILPRARELARRPGRTQSEQGQGGARQRTLQPLHFEILPLTQDIKAIIVFFSLVNRLCEKSEFRRDLSPRLHPGACPHDCPHDCLATNLTNGHESVPIREIRGQRQPSVNGVKTARGTDPRFCQGFPNHGFHGLAQIELQWGQTPRFSPTIVWTRISRMDTNPCQSVKSVANGSLPWMW